MLVSDKFKFIFIHVYKTAGSSMTSALLPLCGRNAYLGLPMHATAQNALDILGPDFFKYTSFAVIRNPWDQLVSRYRVEHAGMPPEHVPTFHDYVYTLFDHTKVLTEKPKVGDYMHLSQADFVCDDQGRVLVTRLLRFEHLQADWEALLADLGLPRMQLPHANRTQDTMPPGSPECDYQSYYTPELWRHVEAVSPDVPLWRSLATPNME